MVRQAKDNQGHCEWNGLSSLQECLSSRPQSKGTFYGMVTMGGGGKSRCDPSGEKSRGFHLGGRRVEYVTQ